MLSKMTIYKGGLLKGLAWNKKTKKNKEVDLTNKLQYHLYDECELEDGVVLKDLLILADKHRDFLSPITTDSPDWLGELIDEGLNGPFKDTGDVETLELNWRGSLSNWDSEKLNTYVHFEGLGKPPNDETWEDWPIDKPVNYALDMSSANSLSELPIKLNKKMIIYDERDERDKKFNQIFLETNSDFTLLDILKGVFWEISFHGSPKDRNKVVKGLEQSIKDIDSGKSKTILWEEVRAKLEKNLKKDG